MFRGNSFWFLMSLLVSTITIHELSEAASPESTQSNLTHAELLLPEVNLFDQLNAFIQSRAKNVSEISENVYFKYYNR